MLARRQKRAIYRYCILNHTTDDDLFAFEYVEVIIIAPARFEIRKLSYWWLDVPICTMYCILDLDPALSYYHLYEWIHFREDFMWDCFFCHVLNLRSDIFIFNWDNIVELGSSPVKLKSAESFIFRCKCKHTANDITLVMKSLYLIYFSFVILN